MIRRYKMALIIDHIKTGKNASRERTTNKITLREMAKEMGCSTAFLCDLEKGRRNWSEKWTDLFDTAIEKLKCRR